MTKFFVIMGKTDFLEAFTELFLPIEKAGFHAASIQLAENVEINKLLHTRLPRLRSFEFLTTSLKILFTLEILPESSENARFLHFLVSSNVPRFLDRILRNFLLTLKIWKLSFKENNCFAILGISFLQKKVGKQVELTKQCNLE